MTLQQSQKVVHLLSRALELEGEARILFINENYENDEEVRSKVMDLLQFESKVDDFIQTPAFRIRPDDAEPLAEGQCLGAYRILHEIGRGGMGSVFLAERSDSEPRRVAIKILRKGLNTEDTVQRFRYEHQILSHLDHPNIAKLLDGGTTEDGRPYFVMEYVEGCRIDEYCDTRKLSVRQRLKLIQEVFLAVHFAHQNLVVHSDLKPANILVTAAGVPKLLDFGIAKFLDREQMPALAGEIRAMTPAYASPEQMLGEPITTASDIYSLGVLLYVLLTGYHPFQQDLEESKRVINLIREKRTLWFRQPPESVTEATSNLPKLRGHLSGELEAILEKAMSKAPHLRYSSVAHFGDDISRYLRNLPISARRNTLRYRVQKFIIRHLSRT